VDRNTLLWVMVVFFGASLMFSTIRNAAEDEGVGIALVAQLTAGALLVVVIILFLRRRR
jgi:lipopolysaccharide export LptBFGC system permease protein LptF